MDEQTVEQNANEKPFEIKFEPKIEVNPQFPNEIYIKNAAIEEAAKDINGTISSLGHPDTHHKIDIVSSPVDWLSASITLGAVFVGAFFAFLSNIFFESRKKHNHRHRDINYVIQSYSVNLSRLLHFKKEFMLENKDIYDDISLFYFKNLPYLHPSMLESEKSMTVIAEWGEKFEPMINNVIQEKGDLNGVFTKWDELGFVEVNAHELLNFLASETPDDLRIFAEASEQLDGLRRTIRLRNELWKEKIHILDEIGGFSLEYPAATVIYEFLALRQNIIDFTDMGLAFIDEGIIRLQDYSKVTYSKRWWKLPKRKWCKFHKTEDMDALIPREKYMNFLRPSVEEVS